MMFFTKGEFVRVTFVDRGRVYSREGYVTSWPVVVEHSDERGDEKDFGRVGVQFMNGFANVSINNVKAV